MLVDRTESGQPVTQADLALYEEECFAAYAVHDRASLRDELAAALDALVRARREFHERVSGREVTGAEEALYRLLRLEAQVAAVRRAYGEIDVPLRAVPTGPHDRRERRRTARE